MAKAVKVDLASGMPSMVDAALDEATLEAIVAKEAVVLRRSKAGYEYFDETSLDWLEVEDE